MPKGIHTEKTKQEMVAIWLTVQERFVSADVLIVCLSFSPSSAPRLSGRGDGAQRHPPIQEEVRDLTAVQAHLDGEGFAKTAGRCTCSSPNEF